MNNISTLVYQKVKHESNLSFIPHFKIKNQRREGQEGIQISGNVISGRGEGAFYMTCEGYLKQFQSKIKYRPYPGTLNVKINSKKDSELLKQIEKFKSHKITGFIDKGKSFGRVRCFEATINNSIPCHIIRLEKTHHDLSVIELISKCRIRNFADIKDGVKVNINIKKDTSD